VAGKYLEANRIYLGRAEELMKSIEPSTVALSFWSPPYFVGKSYERDESYDSWQTMLRRVIELHYDVLKPGGFMVINIADILCFADPTIPRFQAMNAHAQRSSITREVVLQAQAEHPQFKRDELARLLGTSEQTIDRRLHGNNIRGGKYQVQTRVKLVGGSLEQYAYSAGLYLYDRRIWAKDPTWANSRWTSNSLKAVSEFEDLYIYWKPGQQVVDRTKLSQDEWREWGFRGIWHVRSVRANSEHEAQFPLELANRVVRLYSGEGDLVLDPFMGSGTTALACIETGRDYLGIDKEREYVDLAEKNVRRARERQLEQQLFK
jgi:DNA modification methylase